MKTLSAAFWGLVSVGLLSTSGAYASDGTITITGNVLDTTCTVSVNGGGSDATIVLPTVSKTALTGPGDIAGTTDMNLNLSGCPDTGSVRAYFEATNVSQSTGNLFNTATNPADAVQVQVMNSDGTKIDLRNNNTNEFVAFSGTGTAVLFHSVAYVAIGPAGAGAVESQLIYSLEYQ